MGEVIEFPNEAARIAKMAEALAAEGQVHGEDLRDVALWRGRARAAARSLGRPVQTLAQGNQAWAVLKDWPRDEHEQHVHSEKMHRIMADMSSIDTLS